MSEIKDRLLKFVSSQGLTVSEFERRSSLSNGAVSKTSNNIRKATLLSISNAFPDLNMDWLVNGNGEMLKAESKEKRVYKPIPKGNEDYRMVPLINIDSVGGIHSDNLITPSEQYILRMIPFTEAREGDVAILQSGNSMSPTINPGSALLLREVETWREYFGYGNVYVLLLKDGRRITKEVRKYEEDPKNYIWCVSYNPDVADEELPRSMIRGVWKVIKYTTDFGW